MFHVPYFIISLNLINSHLPFFLSHTTITPFSITSHIQTVHHRPTPHTILTNHTRPISSPYQPLALCGNVKPQPNSFPISLNNAHVKPFPPSTLLTPQPTPTLPTRLQHPPRASCPTCEH